MPLAIIGNLFFNTPKVLSMTFQNE